MSINYINPNYKWEKYGITQYQIEHNGKPTKYRAIDRNGEIVTLATKNFAVLPNEEALRVINKSAQMAGLKPFATKNGNQKFEYCEGQPHAIIDKGTRLNAFYYFKTEEIDREKVYFGLHIYNSIDRSTAFGAGAYTFRVTCQNQVINRLRQARGTISQGQTLAYIYEKHTGAKFEEQYFNNIITKLQNVMYKTQDVITAYKTMAQTEVNKKLIQELRDSKIPSKIRPDYIPEKPMPNQDILNIPKITEWQLYNDITENIWHNESTSLQAKEAQYNILHTIMPLQVTTR